MTSIFLFMIFGYLFWIVRIVAACAIPSGRALPVFRYSLIPSGRRDEAAPHF